jgi:hypothetical protein
MLDEGRSYDPKAGAFDGVVAEICGVFALMAGWAAYGAGQNLMPTSFAHRPNERPTGRLQ